VVEGLEVEVEFLRRLSRLDGLFHALLSHLHSVSRTDIGREQQELQRVILEK
jgi:hypothetical protein